MNWVPGRWACWTDRIKIHNTTQYLGHTYKKSFTVYWKFKSNLASWMSPDNPRVKTFMKQTKNTNELQSYTSQSWNLGRSVCHMSLGGQGKGSVVGLQLFLAGLPSLFPGSRPSPWCQKPSFRQLGHLINSRPQNPDPSLLYADVVKIKYNWGWETISSTYL